MSGERCQALAALALAPAVAAVAGTPAAALRALHGPSRDALGTGPLLGALTLLAWALTGWLAAVVAVSLGQRLPGLVGYGAQRCLTCLAPASVRALVRTATGVAVAGTVLLSGTAAHADSLDWPTTAGPVATAAATPAPLPADPHLAPRHPQPQHPAAPAHVVDATAVVVQPGDCLWHLAATALGPEATPRQIATAWPSWWSANRAVIGEDPNLLRPGTTLLPPTHQGAQP
jgi:hypothetical protein